MIELARIESRTVVSDRDVQPIPFDAGLDDDLLGRRRIQRSVLQQM